MENFNAQFVISFLIIALGYCLKKWNILKEKDGEAMARLIFNVTLPSLIIVTFHSITIDSSLMMLVVLGFVYGIIVAILGLFIFRKEARRDKGMLGMLIPGFNIGLFAYPLVQGIWGEVGIKYFGMFDIGNAIITFGVSYLIGSYYAKEDVVLNFKHVAGKMGRSIPLMTYVIIFIINLTGLPLPGTVIDITSVISKANMPLSLLLLGIYLNFSFQKSYWKGIGRVLGIRYGVGLFFGLLGFFLLPVDDMFRYTVLIALILPMATSVLPYSVEFKYNQRFVGTAANLSILISFVLLWVIGNMIV
ncbi:AEC family transporter [Niallia taxi]|uniref:AEC family transporter n=1 Tax=Niallia taxi TaxID=2499688 RepID=UPI0011A4BB51|nr:AEC family transporter [Niallia taxi]MCT2343917.1 AEC family transporter [Niallia taxi]MDE5052983.1 AEC family transporter [Niallia taxi]MED3963690.1 AEC family transporter [Niallia taxi]WOD61625.1 AEC family transporter [Niallia taxi]